MPADSHTLDEEGVVIPPTLLDDEVVAQLVARMRNPDERRGDLRAQLAAHRLAEQRVAELCARRGRDSRRRCDGRALRLLGARDARRHRAAPRRTLRSRRTCSSRSRGSCGCARRSRSTATASTIDFAGTSPQHDGNLNCPLVGRALRLLLRRPRARRPGPAGVRRSVRARRPSARPRAVSSMHGRPPRSQPATSRRRRASSTSSCAPSARRSPSPRRARGR